MRDAARGGAKTPSQRYRSGKTDSSRGIAGSAGSSICSLGDPRKGLGIASRAGGGSGGAAGKANSVSSRQPSRVTDKISQIEQMVIMSKHSGWLQCGLGVAVYSYTKRGGPFRADYGGGPSMRNGHAAGHIDPPYRGR